MMLSELAYQKAKDALAFIGSHPYCTAQEISEATDYPMRRAHAILKKMQNAGILATQRETIPYGYRLQYRVTGMPLPERTPVRIKRRSPPAISPGVEPIPFTEWAKLPAMTRAITPVIEQSPINAVTIHGHTKEQHAMQSAAARRDRQATARGVMYTGESRL